MLLAKFFLIAFCSLTQGYEFDLMKIEFQGLPFICEKERVIEKFGEPTISYPNYECGFYSDEQENGPYYQLNYSGFNWIGSDKEKFVLESIELDADGTTYLQYGERRISGKMTKAEFINWIGDYAGEHFKNSNNNALVIYSKNSDDGARFTFANNRLTLFEYWSPC